MADAGLVKGRITDEDIAKMQARMGYPNPTVRRGIIEAPWNTIATADSIRRYAQCIGDLNPLYNSEDYARKTRWGGPVAPPGYEWSMGINRDRKVPEALDKETRHALRGVNLYLSGAQYAYYRPIVEGVKLWKSDFVSKVEEKKSEFAKRSVIVTSTTQWWDEKDQVVAQNDRWFIHAERMSKEERGEKGGTAVKDEAPFYTDEQIAEIEAAYDNEYIRGADTLYFEDVTVGQQLPKMVKGPFTITDLINLHMGAGWFTYGNPPFRLAYENRKKMRGFYSRDQFNNWDTVQRLHWDLDLAQKVGMSRPYDIGPLRYVFTCHYLSNFVGDDAWVAHLRYELRKFNYLGDTTWITGVVTAARVDPALGPLIEVEITGTNQRGQENINATATVLLASRQHGAVKMPPAPPVTDFRS